MNALGMWLSTDIIENVFAGSLIGGLAISLILFLSVARFPFRLRRLRWLRRKQRSRDSEHVPSFLPATVGISITSFGLFGIISRVIFHLSPVLSIAIAIALSILLFSWLVAATRRLLANTGKPMEGSSLVGSLAHVCLAIPQDGVGAIAYQSEGKRHTMPARSNKPLNPGTRVLVTDLHRRVAMVEELDVWLSSTEAK